MITLPKLLIAAAVILLAWWWLSRIQQNRRQNDAARSGGASGRPAAGARQERAVEDMVKCGKCGAYVPAKGAHDCSAESRRG